MISNSFADPTRTLPRLPEVVRQQHLLECKTSFNKRAEQYLKNDTFQIWTMGRADEEILKEFERINEWREALWYEDPKAETLDAKKEFLITQELIVNHRYRRPHLIAFEYNNTDPSYNASTIILNGLKFIALEAPSKATVENFLNLLHNHKVTHLVRLTPATENGCEKCFPYWEGNVEAETSTKVSILKIRLESEENNPSPYKLHYIWTDSWEDHQSGSADELLSLILSTRKRHDDSSFIAVHCHSGVARTGTFIAGFILLSEIDRQIAEGKKPDSIKISIEKIVKQLSLQRFYMVGKPKQYLTLYRLVDLYVKDLQGARKG